MNKSPYSQAIFIRMAHSKALTFTRVASCSLRTERTMLATAKGAGDAGAWASHELGAVGSVEGKVGKVILGCSTLPPWLDDIYSYLFLSCTPSTVWSKAVSCLCLNPRARLNSKAFEIGACWFQLSRGEHFLAVGPVRRTTTGGI
jgi:hypothetical protein